MVDNIAFEWPCKLKLDQYLPDGRIDPDNWAFLKKFIFDGMQTAKVRGNIFLQNDNIKHIKGFDEDFYIDTSNPRLEIYELIVTKKPSDKNEHCGQKKNYDCLPTEPDGGPKNYVAVFNDNTYNQH